MSKKQKVKYGFADKQFNIEIDEGQGDKYNLEEIIKHSIMTIVHNSLNVNRETGEIKNIFDVNSISMDFYLQFKYKEKEEVNDFKSIPFFNPEDRDKNGNPIILMMKLNPQFCLDETKTRMQIKLLKSKGVPDSRIDLIKESVLEGHKENNPNANGDPSLFKIFPDFFPYVHFNVNEIPRKKETICNKNFTIYSISTLISGVNDPMLNMMFIQNCISHLMENVEFNNYSKITFAYVLEGLKLNLFLGIDNPDIDLNSNQ